MQQLTDDEAALLYQVQRFGSDGYPITKIRGKWFIGPWRSWKGFPTCFKTKTEAVARFESWADLARDRFAQMRKANQNAILTAVGVKS